VLILITTNEDIDKLHPAITRPGRCAAEINFTALSGVALHEWCTAHSVSTNKSSATLAELYELLGNHQTKINGAFHREAAIGFKPTIAGVQ